MTGLNANKLIKINTPSSNTTVNNHNHFSVNIPNDYFGTKKFLLYHQNIRGIYNKIDELQTAISEHTSNYMLN